MRIAIVIFAVSLAIVVPGAVRGGDVELVALDTANELLRFAVARPSDVTVVRVRGVDGTLVGIDTRPSNHVLYGVSTANDVYTIDPTSGVATLVSTLTLAFDSGPRSGLDFNPETDRLRLVGANGQNLRVNVDLGATAADRPLRYATTDRNAGVRPAIAACAYTRAVANAPATKLFDIDSGVDVLALQDPPNDGVLVTIGALGVDFGPLAGFDIVSEGGADRAFAVSGATLFEIDLSTGAAHSLGPIAGESAGGLIGVTAVPQGPGGRP